MPPWLNAQHTKLVHATLEQTIHILEQGIDFRMAESKSESLISRVRKTTQVRTRVLQVCLDLLNKL